MNISYERIKYNMFGVPVPDYESYTKEELIQENMKFRQEIKKQRDTIARMQADNKNIAQDIRRLTKMYLEWMEQCYHILPWYKRNKIDYPHFTL